MNILDGKAVLGTLTTAGVGVGGWLDVAEPVVTIVVTLIVGAVTLWYTVERAMKLKREREHDDQSTEGYGPEDSDGYNGGSVGNGYR